MKNRIRYFRRRQNFTLKELADNVGTTPQTISRLETEVMTLSADWLERLARALGVHPAELLESPERPDIPVLGVLGAGGAMTRTTADERLVFEVRGHAPVAVRLGRSVGPYREGEVLVANRLEGAEMARAVGRDCLCALADGRIVLCRLIQGAGSAMTLVPLETEGEIKYNQELQWAAPLTMRVAYL